MKKKLSKLELALKKIAAALQAYVNDHIADIENPHGVTKTQIGLGNVTNDAQVKRSEMGVAEGVATLDANGKVPASQLPSYVDDVIEGYYYEGAFYEEAAHTTAITPETGKIYIDLSTNKSYRWGGSTMVEIAGGGGSTVTLVNIGETSYTPSSGVVSLPAYPTTLPANGGNAATVGNHTVGTDIPANAVFTDTTYSVMGASGLTHASGLVPDTPSTAGTTKYLREDGTWVTPPDTTYSAATQSAAGLMSAADKIKADNMLVLDNSVTTTGSLTLSPNTLCSLGSLTGALAVSLDTPVSGIQNTYMMEFDVDDSAATPTKVPSFPAAIVWKEEPVWTTGKHYEISIRYSANTQAYYAMFAEFDTYVAS